MREILTHMGLMTNTQLCCSAVGKEITEFHCAMGYWDADDCNDTKLQAFLKVRPDGVAFNVMARIRAFLEFIRPMDSRDRRIVLLNNLTGTRGPIGPSTGHRTKTLRRTPDTLATWNMFGGRRGDKERRGPQLNTTSQWESEAPLLRLPGRTCSPSWELTTQRHATSSDNRPSKKH